MPSEVGSSHTCHSASQSLSQSLRPGRKATTLTPAPNHSGIKAQGPDRKVAAETEGKDKGEHISAQCLLLALLRAMARERQSAGTGL